MILKVVRWIKGIPAIAYLILAYAFIYMPVLTLVLFSFQARSLPLPPFEGPSLQWYQAIFADQRLMSALQNSIVVGILSSLVSVLIGFLAAYGLARYSLPAGGFWNWLLAAPFTVSYLIIGLGLLILFNLVRFPKSLLTVGIGHVVINLPLCFLILRSQLGQEQARLENAARDLGASEWKVLLLITTPLLWPAFLASFLLSFTLSWDEFIIALLVSQFNVTLPVEIWGMLRAGLNAKTNAVGSLVFGFSVFLVLLGVLIIIGRTGLESMNAGAQTE
jgi:spermidine/putrescine transport system permease protein